MLSSTRNPLVKQLRQLGQSTRERRASRQFLIEGTHALAEAIATPISTSNAGASAIAWNW